MYVGYFPADGFNRDADGRFDRNLGFHREKPGAGFHTKRVRTDNYGRLHSRAATGTAVYRVLRLHRLPKDVHGAARPADVRHGRRRVAEKVHRPTGSKGEVIKMDSDSQAISIRRPMRSNSLLLELAPPKSRHDSIEAAGGEGNIRAASNAPTTKSKAESS